ncbi:MAG: ABC transporter ATP-binding protein, partial [Alphaproteobacteria bacterium]|nr:ABC transporter ATP-binding protein [Alphaproteobacteria bacterium]
GEVLFGGENLLTLPNTTPIRGNDITFIPQDPMSSFNPVFPVGTQIMELMKWKSPRLDEARRRNAPDGLSAMFRIYQKARYREDHAQVMQMLRDVQLPNPEEVFRKYPDEMSGGQRQRLLIAMALLTEPKLIIADEPTTALDVTIQAQILKLLQELAVDHGVAILLTTHDVGAAYEICDRICVLYAGQEMEDADIDAFFSAPAHPYTRSLLKSLPGTESEEGAMLEGIPGEIPQLIAPPSGCRFHTRCAKAAEVCQRQRPDTQQVGGRHAVRCHFPESGPTEVRA